LKLQEWLQPKEGQGTLETIEPAPRGSWAKKSKIKKKKAPENAPSIWQMLSE